MQDEAARDTLQFFCIDAQPMVADRDLDDAVVCFCADLQFSGRAGVSHRVIDKVVERHNDRSPISVHCRQRRRHVDASVEALFDTRARPVVVRQVIVSRPFAEPLLSWRRSSFAPSTWVTVTRSSFFDGLVEALSASFDHAWFSPPHRWK